MSFKMPTGKKLDSMLDKLSAKDIKEIRAQFELDVQKENQKEIDKRSMKMTEDEVAMKTSNSPKVVHGKDESKEKGLVIEISTTGGAHAATKEFDSIDDFLDYFDYSRKHHKWLYLIDYKGHKVAIKASNVEFVKEWG